EKPKEEDVRSLLDLLEGLGIRYRVQGGELVPADYRKILEIIENLEFKDLVEKVALRSMTKAVYSTDNKGHFGLAFEAYTHFTSPIRRYPDLEVHRLLKRYAVEGRPRNPGKLEQALEEICRTSSRREIEARDAEREHIRLKSMQFLAGKVGESYDGVVTGVTSFGIFVEITHYLIEGLVHVSELSDDHYVFDKANFRLTGRGSGRVYRLGDPVRVRIKSVSVEEGQADFALAEPG
ncbi:MAG: RNB domain-containing ribonuclease, partial [Spirochaetales bacterium]|nr:RNB domain-containing ribonuclease [Spirochaetales bacterium]